MLVLVVSAVIKVLAYSLVLVVGLWCWFHWKKWDFIQAARKLPCTEKALPILGHAHLLLRSWEDTTKLMIEAISMAAVSKGLYNVCFWCGPLPIVMIHKLEDIQKMVTTSATTEKADEYAFFEYACGNGLLTAPGHIWKVTRRHISPLFHSLHVEQLMPVFNNNCRELVEELAEHVDEEPVNILHPAMSVALKTVCQLIFGTELDFDINSKEFKGLMKAAQKAPEIMFKRVVNPWLRMDFIFEFVYRNELKEIDHLWKEFTQSPLKIAKANHANRNDDSSRTVKNTIFTQRGSINLIDVYTELQKKYPQFSENDLKHEMATLYATGTDTVGLTVSSCLLVLGKKQYIQDRVYEEINAIVGPNDDVTMDHIRRMQYLDQVYKETLRWSMVVPYVARKTTEELTLSDCTIPAGNTVWICLIGPHMDPNIYPNPKRFDPERFSSENKAARSKKAFIPFGSGSRMCIAKNYTDHMIKTMLVHILRRYRVSTDMDIHNQKKVLAVTLINSEGYHIKFQNRK